MKSGSWSPEPGPSRRKRGASNNPIASSGTRKRPHCRAGRPTLPPPARPGRARLFESRSAESQRKPGPPSRTKSPRRPHRRQHALQRRGVDANRHTHRRSCDRHLDPFGRGRHDARLLDRVRPRLISVVQPELYELRPFARREPRLAPPDIEQSPADSIAPSYLGYVHFRIGALGQDLRLLLIAPIAASPPTRDHLDALIRVGIMPGLMHGISAPLSNRNASLAQTNTACEVGQSYRLLTIADAKGKTTYDGAFVTSLDVSSETVADIAACARARWKIENESFNVLKNNGYHLEHNFGHGKQNLAMMFAAMNLLAFAFHTVCDCLEALWTKARFAKRARTRFFEHMRTITAYLVFPDWQTLMTTLITSKPPPEIEKQIRA